MSWFYKKNKFYVNRSHHTLDIYRVEAPVTVDILEIYQPGLPPRTDPSRNQTNHSRVEFATHPDWLERLVGSFIDTFDCVLDEWLKRTTKDFAEEKGTNNKEEIT